ncbi:hypothetical protein, partial [Priestia aryabhattai]|uniref:hypothetical protein n=1 Tax=Priestia aryabhattai TaxID=412384 RepID=UPI001CFA64D5
PQSSAPFLHSIHDVVLKRLSVIIGEFGIAVIEYFTVADYKHNFSLFYLFFINVFSFVCSFIAKLILLYETIC